VTDFTPYARKEGIGLSEIAIGRRKVGDGHPVYIVAEVGINHNGSLDTALALIDIAVEAGCDAVKFQKRSPDHCVPELQRDVSRDTPWGTMTYLQYRHRMEFDADGYDTIDRHCRKKGIPWFASCWDEASVDFINQYQPPCYKIASACLTDDGLLKYTQSQGKPVILSTGMSTMAEIKKPCRFSIRKTC
jgi:N-acetylneuraminate synthase